MRAKPIYGHGKTTWSMHDVVDGYVVQKPQCAVSHSLSQIILYTYTTHTPGEIYTSKSTSTKCILCTKRQPATKTDSTQRHVDILP